MNISGIREHMKVVGADNQPVGIVDHVEGNRIKLTKDGPQSGGKHHYIPGDWVEEVEGDEVCLRQNAKDAMQQWKTD
jgi:hypothetical protein